MEEDEATVLVNKPGDGGAEFGIHVGGRRKSSSLYQLIKAVNSTVTWLHKHLLFKGFHGNEPACIRKASALGCTGEMRSRCDRLSSSICDSSAGRREENLPALPQQPRTMGWIGRVRGEFCSDFLLADQYIELPRPFSLNRTRTYVYGTQHRDEITTFVFSLLAVFVQLPVYTNINIPTSTSSSRLIIQHYMFRPNWPSSGV
jgi:hypothetical protein